uniref:Uncharacterized protein n=1 Tax=Odontella aurita TaxID=265563 RepID=A0A7S4MHA8_9STRA|mmetsp:Transcript_21635/g.63529  ORF Transcript_21635/g.63529 Transcript_21635/m.63529 type:complete len:146 (+) Transcript_21635:205-642(+)
MVDQDGASPPRRTDGTRRYAIDVRIFLAVITTAMACSFFAGVAFGPTPAELGVAQQQQLQQQQLQQQQQQQPEVPPAASSGGAAQSPAASERKGGKESWTVCKEGQPLSAEACKILTHFGVKLAEFRVELVCRWSREEGEFEMLR